MYAILNTSSSVLKKYIESSLGADTWRDNTASDDAPGQNEETSRCPELSLAED